MAKQKITMWSGADRNIDGETTYTTPTVFYGYWEEKQELIIDKAGRENFSKTKIIIKRAVTVPLDSFFLKGEPEKDSNDNAVFNRDDCEPVMAVGKVESLIRNRTATTIWL